MAIRDWFGEFADWWIVAVLASGSALEVWKLLNDTANQVDLISPNAAVLMAHLPFLTFALFVLMVHFSWNWDWEPVRVPLNYYILISMSAVWLLYSLLVGPGSDTYNLAVSITATVTGMAAGFVLWPQRPMSQRRPQDQ